MNEKLLSTLCLYFAFFGSGLVFNCIPTTFNDLGKKFNVTTEQLSMVYTFRSGGYLIGAIAGGLLLRWMERKLFLAMSYSIMGVTVMIFPRVNSLGLLFALAAINGMSSGGSDAGTNSWLLDVHKENSGPYIQGLYFCFAIGISVTALMAIPFLAENNTGLTNIGTLFLIIGIIVLAAAVGIFVLSRMIVASSSSQESPVESEDPSPAKYSKYSKKFIVLIVGLSSVMILLYSGFEICYTQFMVPFVTKSELRITDSQANVMNFGMNIAYTIFRGLAAFINIMVAVELILVFNFASMMIGTVILFAFFNTSYGMLFVGNIFMGIGFSSLFPSIFAFIEKHIQINDTISAVFVFFSGFTAIIYPYFIGPILERQPTSLLYLNVFSILSSSTFFGAIYVLIRIKESPHRAPSLVHEQL